MAGELGDLTEFMKDGSEGEGVAKLDWLDVDEEQYRKEDALPKQNLDVAPDLKALWNHKDESPLKYVPNTGDAPRTMGDMSQRHGPLSSPEAIMRAARLVMMQSSDPRHIQGALTSRFDKTSLQAARTALAGVLAERGLLGGYYIDAADFPACNKGGKQASDFVRKFAPNARFLKAKDACSDCSFRQVQANGASHCSVFHKEIQLEVPYSDDLADAVEHNQEARGRGVQASQGTPRARIRLALLPTSVQPGREYSGRVQEAPKPVRVDVKQGLIAASNLTKKRDEEDAAKLATQKARPIVAFLRREMLKGRSTGELIDALRLSFDLRDLEGTQAAWRPIFKEAGLYGTIYSTQDSFDDCRVGADHLAKHSTQIKAIVAGDKCNTCIFNKAGRCMMYGKKLVKQADEVYTPETVDQVIWEHRLAGNLPTGSDQKSWGHTSRESLKAIHFAASGPKPAQTAVNLRGIVEQGFYGQSRQAGTNDLTKRSILKAASQYLNEGLYGDDLQTLLQSRFEIRDLVATKDELKAVLAEQGLQGIKFIDPTAYDDYGHGCKTAGLKHRAHHAIQWVKAGDKCGSCVHQQGGHCSVMNKRVAVEIPYVDKLAEQRAVLASGRSTEVQYDQLMNSGLSMMAEYDLQHGDGAVNLHPLAASDDTVIEFDGAFEGFKL